MYQTVGRSAVGNRIRLVVVAFALATVAGSAAACAGGGSTPAATQPSSGPGAAFQAYMACLRDHGVNMPSRGPRPTVRPSDFPTVRPTARPSVRPSGRGGFGFGDQPPPGVDADTWNKAQQACASLRPSFGPGGRRDNGANAAYRNCLADHGVTMQGRPDELNSADPKTAAALKACEALRPSARPGAQP
jgi:hypothetical protein